MYIHEFTIRNFLVHRATTLQPSPITVLVGPNGGGKSSLFDAILNFSMLARGSIKQAFGPYPYSFSATKYRASANLARVGFDVSLSMTESSSDKLLYSINYAQQGVAEPGNPTFQIFTETLKTDKGLVLFDRDNIDESPLKHAIKYIEEDNGIFAAVRKAELSGLDDGNRLVSDCARGIGRFNRFRLSPHELSRPSRIPDLTGATSFPPRLGYEGEDLAACLYYMAETKDTALEKIISEVQEVLPTSRVSSSAPLALKRLRSQCVLVTAGARSTLHECHTEICCSLG